MSETKSKFFTLNINSVLQAVIVAFLVYYIQSINSTKDSVVSIAAGQQYILKQQEELKTDMKTSLSDQSKMFMPKSEAMFRFQAMESEMTSIKIRIQANDLDIMRMKEKQAKLN